MTDLFHAKATDWDADDMVQKLSSAISSEILNNVQLDASMQVMDFGAGTGLISTHIAPCVSAITAVDISQAMLEKLAAKAELQNKVSIQCRDIIHQPLNREFDLVVSAMAMHHVEDTALLLKTLFEHMVPGATLALADLDKEDGSFHPENTEGVFHQGFDRRELELLLEKSGFKDVHFSTAITVYKNDKPYPVFLVTAKKLS